MTPRPLILFFAFLKGLGAGVGPMDRAFESKLQPLYVKARTRESRVGRMRDVFLAHDCSAPWNYPFIDSLSVQTN